MEGKNAEACCHECDPTFRLNGIKYQIRDSTNYRFDINVKYMLIMLLFIANKSLRMVSSHWHKYLSLRIARKIYVSQDIFVFFLHNIKRHWDVLNYTVKYSTVDQIRVRILKSEYESMTKRPSQGYIFIYRIRNSRIFR